MKERKEGRGALPSFPSSLPPVSSFLLSGTKGGEKEGRTGYAGMQRTEYGGRRGEHMTEGI
jgi:hypothetical protein